MGTKAKAHPLVPPGVHRPLCPCTALLARHRSAARKYTELSLQLSQSYSKLHRLVSTIRLYYRCLYIWAYNPICSTDAGCAHLQQHEGAVSQRRIVP